MSKSLCSILNPILINWDDGLCDHLPWNAWTIDPKLQNQDAANNLVSPQFHLGKQDAYNSFTGKCFYGQSLSIGNLLTRIVYLLETDENEEEDSSEEIVK